MMGVDLLGIGRIVCSLLGTSGVFSMIWSGSRGKLLVLVSGVETVVVGSVVVLSGVEVVVIGSGVETVTVVVASGVETVVSKTVGVKTVVIVSGVEAVVVSGVETVVVSGVETMVVSGIKTVVSKFWRDQRLSSIVPGRPTTVGTEETFSDSSTGIVCAF